MRKDCKRQTDAKTWSKTVSVKLRDRDIQERERRGRKTNPQARKVPGTVSRRSALATESLVILGEGHFSRGRGLT